jgi:hypothetical protein
MSFMIKRINFRQNYINDWDEEAIIKGSNKSNKITLSNVEDLN